MSARSSLRVISTMKPSPMRVGNLASTGITPFASLARPLRPAAPRPNRTSRLTTFRAPATLSGHRSVHPGSTHENPSFHHPRPRARPRPAALGRAAGARERGRELRRQTGTDEHPAAAGLHQHAGREGRFRLPGARGREEGRGPGRAPLAGQPVDRWDDGSRDLQGHLHVHREGRPERLHPGRPPLQGLIPSLRRRAEMAQGRARCVKQGRPCPGTAVRGDVGTGARRRVPARRPTSRAADS